MTATPDTSPPSTSTSKFNLLGGAQEIESSGLFGREAAELRSTSTFSSTPSPPSDDSKASGRSRPRRALIGLAVVVAVATVLLTVIELILVPVINEVLDRAVKPQQVRIEDVELRPWIGAYAVEGLTVRERSAKKTTPLVEIPRVDAAIDFRALLGGAFVASLTVHQPKVRVAIATDRNVDAPDVDVATALAELSPLRLNRVVVIDGTARLDVDVPLPSEGTRHLDLVVNTINVRAENLTNRGRTEKERFGTLKATATVEGYGDVVVEGTLQPTAAAPTFDIDASLRSLPMPQLSDWSLAFGGFSFTNGSVDLFAEVAAKDGRFVGYVKPLGHDVRTEARYQDLGSQMIAGVVEGLAGLLENRDTKRAGTKIEVSGRFANADVHILKAILITLENAVIRGLQPVVDGNVTLQDVDGAGTKDAASEGVVE